MLPAGGTLHSFAIGSALRRRVGATTMAMATIGVAVAALASPALGGAVIYVDASAPLGGDGQSWATAKRYLIDGIAAAAASDIDEVRVAQGVYTPDQKEVDPPTGDRSASFALHDGLTLRGGYAGLTGGDPNLWDPWTFITVLSGDLLGDDDQPGGGKAENSYAVVVAQGADIVLSGVTITAGNADGVGSNAYGSAVRATDVAMEMEHCRIVGNFSVARAPVWIVPIAETHIRDCLFEGNASSAVLLHFGGVVTIERCDFIGNSGLGQVPSGALGFHHWGSAGHAIVRECRFLDNTANGPGGAISTANANFEIYDSIVAGNSAIGAGGILAGDRPTLIARSVFSDNVATVGGGGLFTASGHGTTIVSCAFNRNLMLSGPGAGAGLYITGPTVAMNLLAIENVSAVSGGGVAVGSEALMAIDHLTSSFNLPNGLEVYSGTTVTHSVVWGNATAEISVLGGNPTIRHSLIEGGWSGAGSGNLSSDPLFVAADSGDFRLLDGSPALDAGLEELLPIEPFDLDGDGVLGPLPVDLLGAPRVQGAAPDLGAFEGAGTPMVPMAAEKAIAPGETATLAPENPLPWATNQVIAAVTNDDEEPFDAVLSEIGWTKHPANAGYSEDGLIAELIVKVAQGAHRTQVRVPIGATLVPTGAELPQLRATVWDAQSLSWRPAATLNTQPSPGHAGPVGDFFVDIAFEYEVPPLSDELGDHGVFWSFGEKKGFVWANVDVSGDFGVGRKLCAVDIAPFDGDGVVDSVDLNVLLSTWGGDGAADINGDGVVDGADLGLLLASWGACDGFVPPSGGGGGEGGIAGGNGPNWPRGRSLLDADLDGDGLINGADLGLLLLTWGECPLSLRGPTGCPDLNGDGVIDGADLGLLLVAWEAMNATR